MRDYQPLDLTRYCNVGTAFVGSDLQPPIGRQTFHGLPFEIGGDPLLCFIGFGPNEALLLRGAGAKLAVAGAGGGEQGTPAKDSAHRFWRHAGRTPGAVFVATVAGAHLRGVSTQV